MWILDPGPGIKLIPATLEGQSLNHWTTTREVPDQTSFNSLHLNVFDILSDSVSSDFKMNIGVMMFPCVNKM